jgi:anthranilate phosphoribosyltransferase
VKGGDAAENAAIARRVLDGDTGPHRDIVTLNAAAGLWVAGRVDDLAAGLELARQSIDSGAAGRALARLIEVASSGVGDR